ncbi:MAG: hypothetical protein JNM09_00675 [Blastocatellia bacterium]|nr:hypothetical protein [Blastocatellia bacterium]
MNRHATFFVTARNFAQDLMILTKLAHRLTMVAEFTERNERERKIVQITLECGTRKLRHHFLFSTIRRDQIPMTGATFTWQ